ncbi:MAG: bifunctional pyr operon transcriptional regulator/uracil phosphoribosyltransferase PyrR [Desulfobacterales bacterium]|jgi:pyrimidine operon attenuation protein/uracil phosphoribosyltransferase|nr:bifunctional pyr operon transcriptional regulator/uracil phosphoribosyltransferase PyrR [Desulfobacterales bacterium]
MRNAKIILDASDIQHVLKRMALEIIETHKSLDDVALIGIHTRGVFLAKRIQKLIFDAESQKIPTGAVDINLYRDDWTRIGHHPTVRKTDISFEINDKSIILVDDVLYTGRTVRSALDALVDFGRPARIKLAVVIDRGHRELPIQANYTGKSIQTSPEESVNVLLTECDGVDRVELVSGQ